MALKAQWKRIASTSIPRSSHTVSVVSGRAYIFGGEIKPREPVDNAVHVVTLPSSAGYPKYSSIAARPEIFGAEVPQARVGHSAAVIGEKIFVFGGRGGADMQPLEENGGLWVFDTKTDAWSFLDPVAGPAPSSRSYHASLAIDKPAGHGTVFIHAGCPKTGRLNDLWAFDVASRTWAELPEAPGKPRGGTSLAISNDQKIVYRFGGFNGQGEEGGQIDYLHLDLGEARLSAKGGWDSFVFAEENTARPGNRSVAGVQAITSKADGQDYLIVFLGERDPSSQGHAGAGKFWSDVWSFPLSATGERKWEEVRVEGTEGVPGERGWFPSVTSDNGEIVLWGGLNGLNERLDNGWILKIE